MTKGEIILWQRLKGRQMMGHDLLFAKARLRVHHRFLLLQITEREPSKSTARSTIVEPQPNTTGTSGTFEV